MAPEWDPANAVSILDVEPVESDEDGDGWRPGPPKEGGNVPSGGDWRRAKKPARVKSILQRASV